MKLLAQASIPLGNITGIGPLGNVTDSTGAINTFTKLMSNIIGLLTIVASLYFIFQLFMGAISWLQSGGDKQNVQNAQKKLTNGFIGLLIVVSAYTLIAVVGYFFGYDILDVGTLIQNLRL